MEVAPPRCTENSGIRPARIDWMTLRLVNAGSHRFFSSIGACCPSAENVIWLPRSSMSSPQVLATLKPEPGNPLEAGGVLNPAAVRGPDGGLYLFPRIVAGDNLSRIGIARVKFNEAGDPVGVERLGLALEPEAVSYTHL